jgi:hypothetical protein
MNPTLILGALLALALAGFGGWHAHTIYDKAEERDRLAATITAIQVDQQDARAISQNLQETLAAIKPTFTTIHNEVQREIVEKPVYMDRNCALPDSGRLRLDTAIDAANRAGRLDTEMPRPADAGREPAR